MLKMKCGRDKILLLSFFNSVSFMYDCYVGKIYGTLCKHYFLVYRIDHVELVPSVTFFHHSVLYTLSSKHVLGKSTKKNNLCNI